MASIDEQLLGATPKNSEDTQQSAERAGALKEARRDSAMRGAMKMYGQPGGLSNPSSLREAAKAAREGKKDKDGQGGGVIDKVTDAITAPMKEGTSKLLKQSWINLIDSFGLTLIWINIHVWLGSIFGNKFFCKLGQEWIDDNIALAQKDQAEKMGKMIGTVEPMGLACCDLGCLFLVIFALSIIALMLGVITNPLEAIKALLGSIWGAITGSK